MIHHDWHGRPLHFRLGVGQWLVQVRRGAKLVKFRRRKYLISFFMIDQLGCNHICKISQLNPISGYKSKWYRLRSIKNILHHTRRFLNSSYTLVSPTQPEKRDRTNKRILRLLNLHSRRILLLRLGILGTCLCGIQSQPRILHRPSRLHRKRNMTIHRRVHGTVEPARNLIILSKSRVADFLLSGRVFGESCAEMVL